MGTGIHGYVEAVRWPAQEDFSIPDMWWPMADVGAIVSADYAVFAALFGVRVYQDSDKLPVAAWRGLPSDVSSKVLGLYEPYKADWHDATWMSLEEYYAFCFRTTLKLDPTWLALCHVMQALREAFPKGVRLVVWFDC